MVDPDNAERLLKIHPKTIEAIKAEAYAEAWKAVSAVLAHEDHCRETIRNYCKCSRFEALNAIDELSEEKQ